MPTVTLCALLLVGGALDDNQAFQEGVSLYEQLEFEQAIFRFEEAALSSELTDPERALIFGWMAMAYAGRGDAEAAKRSLKNAVARDPDVTLPGFAPPKVKEWLDEVRSAARAVAEEPAAPAPEPPGAAAEPPSSPPAAEKPAAAPEGGPPERAPLERTEEFMVVPEEPEESGAGTIVAGLLMMGGGAGSILLGAVLAVPGAVFFFDYYVITQQYLPQIEADIDAANSESRRQQLTDLRQQYQDAANLDLIGGGVLVAPAVAFAALGVGLVVLGAGASAYALVE